MLSGAALSPRLAGQTGPSAQDSVNTRYVRGLNTDEWEGRLAFRKQNMRGFSMALHQAFSSSRLLVSGGENRWKDEHRLMMTLSRRLSPSFSLDLLGTSLLFSDKQSGFVNDIQTHVIGAGVTYRRPLYRIPFFLGVKQDRRYRQHDIGWTGMAGADTPRFRIGDYENRLTARYETDRLERRKNDNLTLHYEISRQFYTDTSDSLRLSWQKGRRDYYISTDGEIESRDEQGRTAENILVYRINDHLRCRVEAGLSTRDLNIHVLTGPNTGPKRQRKDLGVEGAVRLIWQIRRIDGALFFRYAGMEEQYELAESLPGSPYSGGSQLVTPDNRSQYTTLSLHNRWKITPSDTLSLVTSIQRRRYDTPDEANFDDRDELRLRTDIRAARRFSSALSARVTLSAHLLHLVYIFGEKSADNHWTRILRLNPVAVWQPSKRIRLAQSVELLSNYVDYDFEPLLPGIRSFVFRKFQIGDSLQVHLTDRMSLFIHYRLELDENGKLLWKEWLEQKLSDRKSQTLYLTFDLKPRSGFQIMPGYTYFRRTGFRYRMSPQGEQIRETQADFISHGPVLRFQFKGRRLSLMLSGNTSVTKSLSTSGQLLTRIDCRMRWLL
ncbi:MAG TPA: hypothetical protein ENN17_00435 [bacterium]|nr:hypothetical protein [bacterium]